VVGQTLDLERAYISILLATADADSAGSSRAS
jgi:hypothetical protein